MFFIMKIPIVIWVKQWIQGVMQRGKSKEIHCLIACLIYLKEVLNMWCYGNLNVSFGKSHGVSSHHGFR